MNDRKLFHKLKPHLDRVEIKYLPQQAFRIRYADVGNPEKRMILFIHGAPGSLEAFTGFLKDPDLRRKFRLMAVDRPGYGHTDPRHLVTSLKVQAELLEPLLILNRHVEKPILVGHSYGGPVAASLAVQASQQVGGLLLVGAAMDPDWEKTFWVSRLLRQPWLSPLLPGSILSANIEKLSHAEELTKRSSSWKKLRLPITMLHGKQDWIVPVENVFFMDRMMTHARKKIVIKKWVGHLIPWTHPGLIKQEILEMASDIY
jgi:pimeloyl-ACP methyl ester carboxylesterase